MFQTKSEVHAVYETNVIMIFADNLLMLLSMEKGSTMLGWNYGTGSSFIYICKQFKIDLKKL